MEDAVTAVRVDRLVTLAQRARGPAERRWLVELLDRALSRADPGSVAAADLLRAETLGADVAPARDAAPPPHAVVVPFARDGLGLARALFVSFELDAGLSEESLADSSRQAVRDALELATRFAPSPQPLDRFRLDTVTAGALDGLRVDGASLGAAVLVSAVSLFGGRPVLRGTAVSGALRGRRIVAVSHLREKLEALAARADVARVIVPASQRDEAARLVARFAGGLPRRGARSGGDRSRAPLEIIGVADVATVLASALEANVREVADPDLAVAEVRSAFGRAWQGYQWPRLRERLERLALAIPEGRPDLHVAVLTMLGAARRHLGAPVDAWAIFQRAAATIAAHADEVPDAPRAHLEEHLSLAALALGDFAAARRHAASAVRIARRARLPGELLKAHGCVGLVALARRDLPTAIAAQRAALELVHRHRTHGCARTHAYLVDAYGLAGDLGAARAEHDEAQRHVAPIVDAARRADQESWLRTTFGGALVRHGAYDEARRVLDVPSVRTRIAADPLPGLLARRHLGRTLAASRHAGDRERGLELLAASPVAHRDAGQRLVALAHANVLWEAHRRAELGALDADATARALRALDFLPREGRLEKWLAPASLRVRRALVEGSDPIHSLAGLLDHLERLGL